MKRIAIKVSLSVIGLTLFSGAVLAQQRTDFGKREFETNCANCHGVNGKGNGVWVEFLKRSPPDLTQEAKKNQGILPINRLYEVIDGSNVTGHGTRDMPVWGQVYRIRDAEYYGDVPYDPNALVRSRVLALIEYINRIQER